MGVAVGVAVDLLTLGVAVSIADPLPTNSLMTMGFVSIRLVCLYCLGFDTVALVVYR